MDDLTEEEYYGVVTDSADPAIQHDSTRNIASIDTTLSQLCFEAK